MMPSSLRQTTNASATSEAAANSSVTIIRGFNRLASSSGEKIYDNPVMASPLSHASRRRASRPSSLVGGAMVSSKHSSVSKGDK